MIPGPHAYDGSYTDLKLLWRGHQLRVESGHDGGDLVMLVTPLGSDADGHLAPEIVFSFGMLWSEPGSITKREDRIEAEIGGKAIPFVSDGRRCGRPVCAYLWQVTLPP